MHGSGRPWHAAISMHAEGCLKVPPDHMHAAQMARKCRHAAMGRSRPWYAAMHAEGCLKVPQDHVHASVHRRPGSANICMVHGRPWHAAMHVNLTLSGAASSCSQTLGVPPCNVDCSSSCAWCSAWCMEHMDPAGRGILRCMSGAASWFPHSM